MLVTGLHHAIPRRGALMMHLEIYAQQPYNEYCLSRNAAGSESHRMSAFIVNDQDTTKTLECNDARQWVFDDMIY